MNARTPRCRFGCRRNQGKSHFARRERPASRQVVCIYVYVCVPKRDLREILWEQRDSDAPILRRSLPSVSRNEVYRVVPETSKASWRFPRFARIREFSAFEKKHLSGTRLRAHRAILIDSARESVVSSESIKFELK